MIGRLKTMYSRLFRRLYTPDLRSQMLGYFAIICLTRGIAYLKFRDLPTGMEIIGRLIPIWIFAVLWLLMAGAGWIIAYRHLQGRGVVIVQSTLFRLWGAGYLAAWVLSHFTSGDWLAASFYLSVAGIVTRVGRMKPEVD